MSEASYRDIKKLLEEAASCAVFKVKIGRGNFIARGLCRLIDNYRFRNTLWWRLKDRIKNGGYFSHKK